MNKVKVKVFDAYNVEDDKYYESLGFDDYELFDYHNCIVNKNGMVKNKFKPLEHDIVEKYKFEFDNIEKNALSMLSSSTKKAKDLYDSCKRKEQRYKNLLISQLSEEELFDGEHWPCALSPLGHCIYKYNSDELECIFCGQPEERK